MKNETEWFEWFLANFELTDRQHEFYKRGQLVQRLEKLQESIKNFQYLSLLGNCSDHFYQQYHHTIYRFLRMYDTLFNTCKMCSDNIKFPNHHNFYLELVKTIKNHNMLKETEKVRNKFGNL
jgi:hypothetical protein